MDAYSKSTPELDAEYEKQQPQSWLQRLRAKDYRTRESVLAFGSLFENLPPEGICLSIGGGPGRPHPRLTNLNIASFPNVDVVGDAHDLPYEDGTIDAIYCEAVLEHLHSPIVAVKEMFRVLKPGARVFACTPFLQPYHGYPYHFQNFTLTGHKHLFESNGFTIDEAGPCVGPIYAMRSLMGEMLRTYLPFPANRILGAMWSGFSILIGPLDLIVAKHRDAHVLASTTYLLASKPR